MKFSLSKLFKKQEDIDMMDKLLNKKEFFDQLKGDEISEERIQKEWDRVQEVFSLFYFQAAYEFLSDEDRKMIDGKTDLKENGQGMDKFVGEMITLMNSKPDLLNQEEIIKKATELTNGKYKLMAENYNNKGVNNE